MKIRAMIKNSENKHNVILSTDETLQNLEVPPKSGGFGSSINGGELLFLALGTCYCNDIYREALKRGITVHSVEVTVEGEFGAAGEPAKNICYRAKVIADATLGEINTLLKETDKVAEIQNTLRQGVTVNLESIEAISSNNFH